MKAPENVQKLLTALLLCGLNIDLPSTHLIAAVYDRLLTNGGNFNETDADEISQLVHDAHCDCGRSVNSHKDDEEERRPQGKHPFQMILEAIMEGRTQSMKSRDDAPQEAARTETPKTDTLDDRSRLEHLLQNKKADFQRLSARYSERPNDHALSHQIDDILDDIRQLEQQLKPA